jgi:hypothetical protein
MGESPHRTPLPPGRQLLALIGAFNRDQLALGTCQLCRQAASRISRTPSSTRRNSGSGAMHIVLYVFRKGSHSVTPCSSSFLRRPARVVCHVANAPGSLGCRITPPSIAAGRAGTFA